MKDYEIPEYHRAHRNKLIRALGTFILQIRGWRIKGRLPHDRHLVLAAGPHTSNWDFFFGMAAILSLDMEVHWVAKHSIFRWPIGRLLRALGGLPIDRSRPEGVTETIANRIKSSEAMIVGITPEGTRSKVANLKTGFIRIAQAVPCRVLPITLDFEKREIRLEPLFTPGESAEIDVERVKNLFAQVTAKNPQNF